MHKEIERFYVVWDCNQSLATSVFTKKSDADDFARQQAEDHIGDTFVVLEPKEAYRAKATVSPVYLSWPTVNETEPLQAPVI